jgi:hypothetical protein
MSEFGVPLLFGLCALAAMFEAVLLLAKDRLLRRHQLQKIRDNLREAEAETEKFRVEIKEQRPKLISARADNNNVMREILEVQRETDRMQRPQEILVHIVGRRGGVAQHLFRAPINKALPEEADENQKLTWAREHFIEAWARNENLARRATEQAFSAQLGYQIGTFKLVTREQVQTSAES